MGNNFKTFVLLAGLAALLVFAGRALGGMIGLDRNLGLMLGVGLSAIMIVSSYWFSDKIALASTGAREVSYSEAPDLHRAVDFLAQRAGLPKPRVYLISDATPNAFATGRNPSHAAIAVTTGIMDILNREELEGVLAHEFSHIKNRDILISSVAALLAGVIASLASWARWGLIFGMGRDDEDRGDSSLGLLMMIVAPFIAMLIQLAVSRSREFQADETGARICGRPQALASALEKLERANQMRPLAEASPANAHMFIVNPFNLEGIMRLMSTHPPIPERVARLQTMHG
jgi:heat shock protein HtpX